MNDLFIKLSWRYGKRDKKKRKICFCIIYIFETILKRIINAWSMQRSSDAANMLSAEWSLSFTFSMSFSQSLGSFLILNVHLLPLLFHCSTPLYLLYTHTNRLKVGAHSSLQGRRVMQHNLLFPWSLCRFPLSGTFISYRERWRF